MIDCAAIVPHWAHTYVSSFGRGLLRRRAATGVWQVAQIPISGSRSPRSRVAHPQQYVVVIIAIVSIESVVVSVKSAARKLRIAEGWAWEEGVVEGCAAGVSGCLRAPT